MVLCCPIELDCLVPGAVSMSERDGPKFAPGDFAGFWRRTTALAIDGVILLGIDFITPELWYHFGRPEWETYESYAWIELGLVAFILAYHFGFRLTPRGTPGYRIVGICYVYMLGGRPPVYMILYRSAIALFLLWFFALDHWWILFDKRKQAWHDKVSGFYVVKKSAQPRGTQRIVRRVVNFMLLTFVVWEPDAE